MSVGRRQFVNVLLHEAKNKRHFINFFKKKKKKVELRPGALPPEKVREIVKQLGKGKKVNIRRVEYDGTPEEKRIEFYYALAAGAKGISYWWFTPYGRYIGCGASDPSAKSMMQEMARLNAEARAVMPLLATACPGAISGSKIDPFASSSPPWLMVRTLFAGTHTAILILIN